MNKISIIVPAFNAENTIKNCIYSILHQTYNNFEIIVINDGSTDGTLCVLEKLQKIDNRVKVISIPNGGVSHARNIGLANVSGDFVAFVDADDTIDEDMLDNLVKLLLDTDSDVAHCSYKNIENNQSISIVGNNDGKIIIQDSEEAIECLISGNLFSGGVWNKLYRFTLFEGIIFNENIKYNEDILINFYLFRKCNRIVYLDKPFYNYLANDYSATHSASAVKIYEDFKQVSDIMAKESENKIYYDAAVSRKAYMSLVLYRAYLFSNDKMFKQKKKKLLEEIKGFKNNRIYVSRNDKLSVILFSYFPHIYKFIYRLYDKVRVKKLDPT